MFIYLFYIRATNLEDEDGNMNLNFSNGFVYQFGHGREKCSRVKCFSLSQQAAKKFPHNCGFNEQWWLPDKFWPCGDYCSGGFCTCLSRYNNNNNNKSNNTDREGGRRRK